MRLLIIHEHKIYISIYNKLNSSHFHFIIKRYRKEHRVKFKIKKK
jgi:hypothetical protein